MHVFVAFDREDSTPVGELTAELAAGLSASAGTDRGRDLRFETWAPEPYPGASGGAETLRPCFHDSDGRVLVDDARPIATAAGLLAVITDRAADSVLVRAQLEIAYSHGVPVAGLQVDPTARPPRNLSARAVLPVDVPVIVDLLVAWGQRQQQHAALPWHHRLRRTLTADRDARR